MSHDAERVATSYCVAGDGEPVILVHGLGEDHRSWRPQQGALASTCRTIAYDLRGHGMTPVGDGDGTLAQLGQDLFDLIDAIGGPCTLVGYSLGGTVAMWAAAERPEVVTALVLLGTSAVVGRRAAAGYLELIEMVARGDRQALEDEVRRNASDGAHSQDADIDRIAALELDAIGTGEGYANAARAMARLHEEPLTLRLGAIRCPTIVASGEFDAYCPRSAQETIVDGIPDAEYVEISGAAHLLNADAPAAVTDVILKALHG
jgi:pimeloyl-ACP methyl ester carboxylesterase